MEVVSNPTPPRRSNRIRRAKEDKAEVSSDDSSGAGTASSLWSENELQIFLDGLKEYGTAWKKIASTLRNRTPQMVEELYQSNYHYLTLPSDAPRATVLYNILKDRQREQILADMEGEEEVAAVVLAEGQKESEKALLAGSKSNSPHGSLSPKRKVKAGTSAAVVMTPERSKRVKSTRQLFPPSPVSTRRKATSTPKQTPTKKQKTQHQSRSVTPPKSTRVLRTRKSASSAEVAANGGTPPPSNSDGLPLKLREKFLKGKMGESPAPPKKKKGTAPSTPTSKRKKDLLSESTIAGMQNQLQNFLNGKKALNWCMYEWFYADIDRPFFDVNDFQNCLDSTGVGKVTNLSRVEWGFVRTVFGKARRFSPAFLKEEREKLAEYRESIRQLRHGKSPISRAVYQFPYIPPSLPQSTRVLAFHPETRQLQLGTVIAEEYSRYKIEFDNKDLGPQWITDTDVMAHEAKEWPPARTSTNASPRTPVRQRIPNSPLAGLSMTQQIEVTQLYELVKLLKQKEDLIQRLRRMNEEAEKMALRSDFPTEFQRHYALAVKKLVQVNELITPRLQNIRTHTPQPSPGANSKDGNHAASPWPPSLFPAGTTSNGGSATPAVPAAASPPGTTSASNSPPSPSSFTSSSSSSSSSAAPPPSITFSSPSSSSTTPATIATTITTTTTTTTTKQQDASETKTTNEEKEEEEKEEEEEEEESKEIGTEKPVLTPTHPSPSSSKDDEASNDDASMPDAEESSNTPP